MTQALTLEQGTELTKYREVCAAAWGHCFASGDWRHPEAAAAAAERFYDAIRPDGAIAQAHARVVVAFGGSLAVPAWVERLLARIRADDGLPIITPATPLRQVVL